jgi:protein transport protein SEC39
MLTSAIGYTLVKTIYEDAEEKFLADQTVQDAVECAALDAFDNASNPNRTRGGLKKCNDM